MKKFLFSLIVFLVYFLVCGCPGPGHYSTKEPNIQAISHAPIGSPEIKTVTVMANAGWQSTGIKLQEGDTVQVISTGTWYGGPFRAWVGGDGENAVLYLRDTPIGLFASLLGRVGNGYPFLIGSERTFQVKQSGILLMRPNEGDNNLSDNRGSLSVQINRYNKTNIPLAQEVRPVVTNPNSNTKDISSAKTGQSWAVIIGISDYKDTRIPSLRYASADAKSFYNWAILSDGGKYAPSRVKLLIDQDATGRNIKNALFIWLKQALQEDIVTIYFAGHGSPESPDSPNNLFLLPYDAKYDEIASSGFPMWDIETALKRYIKAKKVVVIADACHSGGVGQSYDVARRASRAVEVNPISSGLQNLSQIGDGVCVMSASDNKQFSQESKDWGGGHGVFTYFLLEGLKGNADYNKDTNVTLGELIPYLSEQVRRATKNAQSPTVAGKFDPALSIGR